MDVDDVDVEEPSTSGRQTRSATNRKASGATTKAKSDNTKKGKSRKSKTLKEVGWCEDLNGGPPITKTAGNFLAAILHVWSSPGRQALETLLRGPDPSSSAVEYDPTDTAAVVNRLDSLSLKTHLLDLEHMLALVQLALNVDSEIYASSLTGKFLSKSELARRYTKSEAARTTFCERVSWGQRFAFLCSAGTLGILPILAALELRTVVTRQLNEVDILCLGSALREVQHGKWLPMVRRLMLPINYILNQSGYVQTLHLSQKIHTHAGSPSKIVQFGFKDVTLSDSIFDQLQINVPKLIGRSQAWQGVTYSFNKFADRSTEWDLTSTPPCLECYPRCRSHRPAFPNYRQEPPQARFHQMPRQTVQQKHLDREGAHTCREGGESNIS
ncbi:hypothetical protein C8F04DRAFT_426280 [Mycena alexandri]|uniref:Uncharacterized protein n=1 Tax=Mycena alexandri TaxID=1745969 RepID=A0AAD6RY49_9AGAR|nr:hypothetical protein C8F04DRAFT_426280 [Mycena alexandri]